MLCIFLSLQSSINHQKNNPKICHQFTWIWFSAYFLSLWTCVDWSTVALGLVRNPIGAPKCMAFASPNTLFSRPHINMWEVSSTRCASSQSGRAGKRRVIGSYGDMIYSIEHLVKQSGLSEDIAWQEVRDAKHKEVVGYDLLWGDLVWRGELWGVLCAQVGFTRLRQMKIQCCYAILKVRTLTHNKPLYPQSFCFLLCGHIPVLKVSM